MNVLILTPDAVGSTLLQRMITIYMQFHQYDKPVINLHELTNGLTKYYNNHFNQEMLGKLDGKWGYYQSLPEIVDLLEGADHYKTSRLAHYHIRNRQDNIEHQLPFYNYLNDNFFIISCRRHNVFEHALSWCINKVTKKLNVYSPTEKVESFYHLYRDGFDIDLQSLVQTLESYKLYLQWCENHFSIASYFYYDEHLPNIEKYILNLPLFAGQPQLLTWKDNFNIDFDDWNRCHYYNSDIGTLALNHHDEFMRIGKDAQLLEQSQSSDSNELKTFLQSYKNIADDSWPVIHTYDEFRNLPQHIQDECAQRYVTVPNESAVTKVKNVSLSVPPEHVDFLNQHSAQYISSSNELATMKKNKIITSMPPIKKQTMLEKRYMIRNFNQCLDVYNSWIEKNPEVGLPIDNTVIDKVSNFEQSYWSSNNQLPNDVPLASLLTITR